MATAPGESQWHNASTLPSIEVRVTLANEATFHEPLTPALWWQHVKPEGAFSNRKEHWEWVLRTDFPEQLRSIWGRHFGSTADFPQGRDPLVAQFAFRVKQIHYGSLSFDLEIAGLGALARLLDHNFALFQMLTEMYVPQAFTLAFGLQNTPAVEQLDFSYAPAAAVIAAFSTRQTVLSGVQPPTVTTSTTPTAATTPASSRDDRLQWFWKIANFSLVVPVLLALLVLWAFVKASDRLESTQLELTKLMLEQQKTVLDAQTRRNTDMERLTIDVLRQVLPAKGERSGEAK